MKTMSVLALLLALGVSVPAVAAGATVNANGGVSANAGGTSVNANGGGTANANGGSNSNGDSADTTGGVGASASTNGAGVDASTSTDTSTSASVGSDRNGSSSATPDSSSSMVSAADGSSSGDCSGVDKSAMGTGPIDPDALNGVTSVTVVTVSDCSGLSLDQGAGAALGTNPKVSDAIKAAGYAGQEILGYSMDGNSLTVYVKKS